MIKGPYLGIVAFVVLAACGGGDDSEAPAAGAGSPGGGSAGAGGSKAGAGGATAGSGGAVKAGSGGGNPGGAGSGQGGAAGAAAGSGGAGSGGSGQGGAGQGGAAGSGGSGQGGAAAGAGGSGQGGAVAGAGGAAAGTGGAGQGGAAGVGGGSKLSFAIIGDFGVDSGSEAVVAEMVKAAKPELVITLGDNNYPDGKAATIDDNIGKYYAEFIAPYKGAHGPGAATNRFFPSAGNHDWNTGVLDPYLDYFELPGNERYYDFVQGPVHFFALDSDDHEPDGNDQAGVQGQWLKAKLAASTAPFKVVYFHHPPFSSGQHGDSETMQWPFAEWGASAILTGHDHTYERFTVDGIPYIVNGLGGAGLYQFANLKPESEVRYNASHGAMFAEATDEALVFQARNVNGELIDEVTVLKGQKAPASQVLVAKGDGWRYLDGGVEASGWRQPGFDDGAWKEGPAPLGYGDPGMSTTVSYGGDAAKKYLATYFRKTFAYGGGAPLSLGYALRRDDGAVLYLNGVEVGRSNMPGGAVDASTLASTTMNGSDETTYFKGTIDPALLLSGQNVLAVELHQAAPDSSDLGFDLELRAAVP